MDNPLLVNAAENVPKYAGLKNPGLLSGIGSGNGLGNFFSVDFGSCVRQGGRHCGGRHF